MSTTAKLVHLSTERRRRKYTPPDPLKIAFHESIVADSLAEVERLWALEGEQLIAALQIGGAEGPC